MSAHCKLVTLMLAVALHGQVHTLKIIGGHEAVPNSRPYMVLLKLHVENNKIGHCGGFLLNEDFVMTAAHCQAKSYEVLLGVHNVHKKSETQTLYVKHVFPHQDYNANGYKNDIMLLKLSSKAKFNKNVSSIALAEGDSSLPRSCIVSGWGKNKKNIDSMSICLMEVNVTLIDEKQCKKENSYCSKGEIGPAEGDSGGPLVCEGGNAYGVVSSSTKGEDGRTEMISYTKIANYRKWIDSTMEIGGKKPWWV
ncbi:Granzyme-like protein 1 [Channa argus]|uniref:trypsin n=1 Tax=Channa argus TaxID=215402 RepID=A0A6G1PLL6_CHAAH|nr:Granzyme-like protein 1 [Channa argus]